MAEFTELISKGLEELGNKIAPKLQETKWAKGFFSDVNLNSGHPATQMVYDLFKNHYTPMVHDLTSKGVAAAKNSPVAMDLSKIQQDAHKAAYNKVFGYKSSVIHSAFSAIEQSHGPGSMVADNFSDWLHIQFQQEHPKNQMIKNITGTEKPGSIKTPLQKDLEWDSSKLTRKNLPDALQQGLSQYDLERPQIAIKNSPYKGRAPIENGAAIFNRMLAFHAPLYHAVGTPINIFNADGARGLIAAGKASWGSGREAAENALMASGYVSELNTQPHRELGNYQDSFLANPKVQQFIPNSIGEFIHKNLYQPGMSSVRRWNLISAGVAGKATAEEAVGKLKNVYQEAAQAGKQLGPTDVFNREHRWTKEAFRRFNLDEQKIVNQGFRLQPEDMNKVFHHSTNEKAFLSPYSETPMFWRQSPLLRASKTFTGFATQQAVFLRKDILSKLRAGDLAGLGRSFAIIALIYPPVGATLTQLVRLSVGEDWDDPMQHWENRLESTPAGAAYDIATGQSNNLAKTIYNTADSLARMAVFGSIAGYSKAAWRDNLLLEMAPPGIRTTSHLAESVGKAVTGDENHPDAWKPLGRDVLEYGDPFYGTGTLLRKELLPTKAEEAKASGKRTRTRRRSHKVESSNPLSYSQQDF